MLTDANYASTLAALEPDFPFNLTLNRSRLSLRYQGTMQQNLRKPSKIPDMHRPYVLGDPTNRIDWRAFARTDELTIREVHEEAAARVLVFVDTSESMTWPPDDVRSKLPQPTLSKTEIAMRVAFHLGYTHIRAGDLLSFVVMHKMLPRRLVLRNHVDVSTYFDILKQESFSEASVEKLFDCCVDLDIDWSAYDRRIIISDMLDTANYFSSLKMPFPALLLHCLNIFELDVDWLKDGVNYFDDAEIATELPGSHLLSQRRYQLAVEQWRAGIEAEFISKGGSYLCLNERTRISDFHQYVQYAVEV